MKYSQLPADLFKHIQINAGVIATTFMPDTGELQQSSIVGATSGGVNFTATPSFSDYGEDIDNCPKNMKELKRLDSWEAKASGTFVSVSSATAKLLAAAADVSGEKITPRGTLKDSDFSDMWIIGDYSEINEDGTTGKAGFIAIHLLNSLSTGGFQLQTGDKSKGQFSFEFTGHYSMEAPEKVPFELYIKQGTADAA
ncbi:hypothetical protein [uncultured Senegalimassilia sp.]|uniref:hypothetical protein n=1 Tax=uncultured Senegalimassilia sp. TaxID=1714350 RepID=UPI0025FC8AE0|nr:hypothetical protein [uncultured Senegalimassilia sp.]